MTEHSENDVPESKPTYGAAAEYAALANALPSSDSEPTAPTAETDPQSPEKRETAQELRAAQEGWLQRRDLLEDTPHLTLKKHEFELLKDVGLGESSETTALLIHKAKQKYDLPSDAQYVSIDIVPENPDEPHTTELVAVQEEDFGTVVDDERLESQGLAPGDMPRVAMNEREFELFKNAGVDSDTASLVQQAREFYGVPQGDQLEPQYALIDIESDDPNQPNQPLLVVMNEADFGTVIDRERIDKDFQSPTPDSPLMPDTDTYRTVDISKTLTDAWYDLKAFAAELMKGKTENPLSGRNFWLRAGDLMDGQKDAYIWDNSKALAGAVELTINNPHQYKSVCAVVGERQDPRNGKPTMAQVMNPEAIFKIEGENLKLLQDIYRRLYHEPDFALTPEQKSRRDEVFNGYLVHLTSEEASKNKSREDDENRRRSQQLQTRARPLPGSDPYRR